MFNHPARHFFRSMARCGVRAASPRLDRLMFRAYCSRLNGALRWFMAGTEEIEYGGALVRVAPAEMIGYHAYFTGNRDLTEISRLAGFCHGTTVFADVGANIGLITLPVAAQSPGLQVFAFEPDPRNLGMLRHNVTLNPALAPRVCVVAAAASDTQGTALFESDDDNSANSRIVPAPTARTCCVPTIRLDEYFTNHGRYPEVVKIDVEGAELRVLQGMTGLFARHPPHTLFIEVHAFSAADRCGFKTAIRDLLLASGYSLHHPYADRGALTPWDDITAWPDHFSLWARHHPATEP